MVMDNSAEGLMSGSVAAVMLTARWSGAAPLCVTTVKDGRRVTLSPLLMICAYCLSSVLTAMIFTGLIMDLMVDRKFSVRVNTNTRLLAWLVDASLTLSVMNVGMFWAHSRMCSTITCFNILEKINIDLDVNSFKWHRTRENYRSGFFIIWSIIIAIFVCMDLGVSIKTVFSGEQNPTSNIISSLYVAYYISFWINYILQMQFFVMAMSIVSSFKALNEHLKLILQEYQSSKYNENLPIGKKVNNTSLNSVIDCLAFRKKIKPNQITEDLLPPHELIRRLSATFALICDLQRRVDQCHGPVVLLLLGATIMQLIIKPYNLIYNTSATENPNGNESFGLQMFRCIMYGVILIILMEPGYYTHIQVEKTKFLLSSLMQYSDSTSEPLAEHLELFYRQLMLNEVVYSPMGITSLTRPVTAGLFGSILTYFIVLMQL